MRSATVAAALALAAATPAWGDCGDLLPTRAEAAMARRKVGASDLIQLRDIGAPDPSFDALPSPLALSPDGHSVAFLISRADLASNGYCLGLVVMPSGGTMSPRIVDRGDELILATDVKRGLIVATGFPELVVPQWSPDGQWIGYLKRVAGVTQVWRVRADGSNSGVITASTVDIERWRWASDGRTLIFASRPAIASISQVLDEEAESGFLYDDRIRPHAGVRPHLREADVPLQFFRVNPDDGQVDPATMDEAARLALDPSASSAETGIVGRDGRKAGTEAETTAPLSPRRIWATDRAGRKVGCAAATCSDGILNLWWADDGSLIFQRREGWAKGRMAIYRWSPGAARPRLVTTGHDWLLGCLYHGERLLCTSERATMPRRIVSLDLANGKSTTLFDPNPGFARLALGTVERLEWRNEIGLPAWGDLVLPPDYKKSGTKLPLVVVQYHSDGFLRGGTGDAHPIFLLAAHGFAVLSVERAPIFGSNDPGLKTVDQIITAMTRDWAERRSLLSSLLTGVDRTIAAGVVDRNRVGITGLSDGASTVEYALINSERFAAASISTCCEDPKTVMTYGGTAWADWNRSVRGYPLASQDGNAFWKDMSIALNADRIRTPILMQLADSEYLLGLEAFTALREQHRPVEMYVAPGEYHVRAQPSHRRAEYERDVDWFRFWLQGVEDPAPGKQAQYQRWRAMRAARSPAP